MEPENAQPQIAEPDFIPKDCLRLNSPYMLQSSDKKEPSSTDKIERAVRPFDPTHHFDTLKSSLGPTGDHKWTIDDSEFAKWLGPTTDQLRVQISGGTKIDRTSAALFVVDHLQGLQSSASSKTQVLYFFCHRPFQQRRTASAVLKGWMSQLLQQRPIMMKDFCECVDDPVYFSTYLDQARMMWAFLRRAAKLHSEGITYCILDGLEECDTEDRSLIIELLTLTLPLEGCPEAGAKFKILVTTSTPLDGATFSNIDLTAHAGSKPSLSAHSLTIDERLKVLSNEDQVLCSKALQLLAAFLHPPTTEQFQDLFPEENWSTVFGLLNSCPTKLLVTPDRIEFVDSDAWLARSKSKSAADYHTRLAKECLDAIEVGLTQIDIADLENDDESSWMSQASAVLKYATMHWADHLKLSKDTEQNRMDLILRYFGPNSTILEKWWIMFMAWNYGISRYSDLRRRYTTPLHMFALLDLVEILDNAGQDWLFEEYATTQDAQGLEPLDIAILHNHVRMAEILSNEVSFTTTGQCTFAAISSAKLANIIFSKLDSRFPELPEKDIENMLWNACYRGDLELLEVTITFAIGKTSGRFFPWNNTAYAEDIIDSGDHRLLRPILITTNMKEKAYHIIKYATEEHEPRMLEEILRYEVVDKMIKGKQIDLRTALNTALKRRSARMANLLLNEDTMDHPEGRDLRPLKYAVKYPNIHTLKLFLAQPKIPFNTGVIEEGVALNLMLHHAGADVDIKSLDQLLKRGARMRYEDFGMTALHVAAEIGRMSVMEILLDNLTEDEIKEDIDRRCSRAHRSQGREGMTALAIAALKGSLEIVQCLLDKGANIDVEDRAGKTAVQLAREADRGDIADMILDS
ncbi:uncharacterized protein J4E87_000856 [Alternaria ethzedia]|uniref:uncharacterized protein n=1 Tax=Alternaria ethzedia TaxID=181014 RepID=UPI0020C59A84|nr:uncharacterized protein J4E87_000856 [Alternaria ethzedia]KAI4633692.1 hypothetical protein J4E87_000856 [Alternaria ethzedia]